jgi:hypothetical protein
MAEQKALATQEIDAVVEQVVVQGDLAKLTPQQRVVYYRQVCESLGLNPYTQPFQYITLNGKLTLYPRKDATDQLRKINAISIDKPDIRFEDDWIIVTVTGRDQTGRTDSDVGAVSRKDMRGDFGNNLMKAVTKAKRRLTLSLVGLGWLDETEVETIPDAHIVPLDVDFEGVPEVPMDAPVIDVPDWARLKAAITKQQLPVSFRDGFVALAQSQEWSRERTASELLSWQKAYQDNAAQALADLADMARLDGMADGETA